MGLLNEWASVLDKSVRLGLHWSEKSIKIFQYFKSSISVKHFYNSRSVKIQELGFSKMKAMQLGKTNNKNKNKAGSLPSTYQSCAINTISTAHWSFKVSSMYGRFMLRTRFNNSHIQEGWARTDTGAAFQHSARKLYQNW